MATARTARRTSEARRGKRVATGVKVALREQGQRATPARLIDISRFGFRVDVHGLAPESIVWLRLPDAEPQMARVVWSDHKATGCLFTEMLEIELFRRTIRSGENEAMVITGPWKPTAA
ncbi:PilZ domain-containing protein [Hephaestia mangrovi]|uniref:PilZ domain-containing protein n=1 Tax=Hephaestia mangrovi TaxID=2873268 RepID=UPI001CA72BFF|nr:PilZ domain-containing protein [Hephaestia mangrovi]MBY8826870.1 PilZ domain-containing protein [Hephaestia mangrovi]